MNPPKTARMHFFPEKGDQGNLSVLENPEKPQKGGTKGALVVWVDVKNVHHIFIMDCASNTSIDQLLLLKSKIKAK